MTHVRRILYWTAPSLLCLLLYWFGLRAWFQQDDFAWLGLDRGLHHLTDWPATLFAPKAQGSIRPWSERVYFITLHLLFGMRPFPFKAVTFATTCFDLALLCVIMRRLTGSKLSGIAAPALWVCNTALIVPLSWVACYNEIQCSGFLLLSFYLFLRYIETDDRRWYWAQMACFTIGLGSLELDVVYPALALAYALCCARRAWRSTIPLFGISLAYTFLHRAVAPKEAALVYRMYFDTDLLTTFGTYWTWVLGPGRLHEIGLFETKRYVAGLVILTVLILGFALWQALKRKQYLGIFFLAWYCITLGPILPLRNHVTDYYLTIPALGIAMFGGWALAEAWRTLSMPWMWRAATAGAVALYVGTSLPVIRVGTGFYFQRGREVENVVQSMAYAQKIHPGKIILVKGVSNELFYAAFYDRPYRLFDLNDIYLTPESEPHIASYQTMSEISSYFLPAAAVGKALEGNQAVVYEVDDPLKPIRNVTSRYFGQLNSELGTAFPRRVEPGNPVFEDQLGDGWYGAEGGFRWMPQQASAVLGGPTGPEQKLRITAHCPDELIRSKPAHLTVLADGKPIGTRDLDGKQPDELVFALPPEFLNRSKVLITLSLDRTVRIASDNRDLGLAVRQIAIR